MNHNRTPFDERAPRWMQCLLRLTRTYTYEQRRRLVCIPDRMSAENERDKLARQHGSAMSDPKISKNGKGKDATWTVSYTLSEQRTEELF
ncbi:MAG TPA: hypothetical protein VI454_15630 [Verrucomicrobiae bacterium]|jgi:hypothetical protein